MKPIIFLDGVGTLWTARGAGVPRTAIIGGFSATVERQPSARPLAQVAADAECIRVINRACEAAEAKLVMFGAWRTATNAAALEGALETHGMTARLHADWRTDGEGPTPWAEVQRWLSTHHQADQFAVVGAGSVHQPPEDRRRVVQAVTHAGIDGMAAAIVAAITGETEVEVKQRWSQEAHFEQVRLSQRLQAEAGRPR